jgi:hypothetical protein
VDGDLVFQGDNPQDSSAKLLNSTPESPPIAFLPLHSNGILQDLNAPFFFKIGPFTQYLILKIQGILVLGHMKIYAFKHKKAKRFLAGLLATYEERADFLAGVFPKPLPDPDHVDDDLH